MLRFNFFPPSGSETGMATDIAGCTCPGMFYYVPRMRDVKVGIIGLGNVGTGTLAILMENREQIAAKLGFDLRVASICSRSVLTKTLPLLPPQVRMTANWREVVEDPEINIVAELVGGTGVAREIIDAAIRNGKSVVTANKELMAKDGASVWESAIQARINVAMEASVAGGIPIHTVLREGISGDRIVALYGILNGTSNFILTEIEKHGSAFDAVLAEAQRLGYAEADPTADIDGHDARSKLALLAALAFGERITPSDIYMEGIRRITPIDFQYARQLGYTIRLICSAKQTRDGLLLAVRPSLVSLGTVLASVKGAYNAVWVQGKYGEDTFYYGRGAGPRPTGVAVVSDLMRVAREIRCGSPERVSPFAHERLGEYKPIPITLNRSAYYLRFRVEDKPGIIARLATALAEQKVSIDSVMQLPIENWRDVPFVVTVEPTTEESIRSAMRDMLTMNFLLEPPLVMPMENPMEKLL